MSVYGDWRDFLTDYQSLCKWVRKVHIYQGKDWHGPGPGHILHSKVIYEVNANTWISDLHEETGFRAQYGSRQKGNTSSCHHHLYLQLSKAWWSLEKCCSAGAQHDIPALFHCFIKVFSELQLLLVSMAMHSSPGIALQLRFKFNHILYTSLLMAYFYQQCRFQKRSS